MQLPLCFLRDGDQQHGSRIHAHDSIPIHKVRQILRRQALHQYQSQGRNPCSHEPDQQSFNSLVQAAHAASCQAQNLE